MSAFESPRPRLLFLDDEPGILSAIARVLREEDWALTMTVHPAEALELVSRQSFAVIVSDQRMPEMTGIRFLQEARVMAPNSVRILLTGYLDIAAVIGAINTGEVYRFLSKPWDDGELRAVLQQAVAQYGLLHDYQRLLETVDRQNAELRDLNRTLETRVRERTGQVERLNRDLEGSLRGTIRVLSEVTELHSTVLGAHAYRVAALAGELGAARGFGEAELRRLEMAALLHDLGEVGIPPEILTRSEEDLSPGERELYRQHPGKGEALVLLIPHLPEVAAAVRGHHERWDGTGYPDRRRGHDIPPAARIIAVADAYDRALNARHGFATATPSQACRAVSGQRGRAFDPDVVDALSACLSQGDRPRRDDEEVQVRFGDLRPGMRLSRPLVNGRGILLLGKEVVLQEEHFSRLRKALGAEVVEEGIFVFRRSG